MASNKERQQRFRQRAKALAGNEVLATVERILTDGMDEAYALTREDETGDDWRARHGYVLAFAATPAAPLRQHLEDCLLLAQDADQTAKLKRAGRLIELVMELSANGVT